MGKIVVHRRGYHRRGFYIHRHGKRIYIPPHYVPPTTYTMKDRGAPGKAPKSKQWYHPKRKLKYNGKEWHAHDSAKKRRKVLDGLVKERGYATVVRELNALHNVTVDRKTKMATESDLRYLQAKYKGGR